MFPHVAFFGVPCRAVLCFAAAGLMRSSLYTCKVVVDMTQTNQARPNKDKTNTLLAGKHVRGPRAECVLGLAAPPRLSLEEREGKNCLPAAENRAK